MQPVQFTREQLIEWLRMNAHSFIQFDEEGRISVDVSLPKIIKLPNLSE